MLGDYMDYNARPPSRKSRNPSNRDTDAGDKLLDRLGFSKEQDLGFDEEDGYDPYNHPIDRRFLE